MTDYKLATWIPNNNYFANTGKKSFIILHSTAGGDSAEGIAKYFKSTEDSNNPVSSHYVIGKDGTIVQCVAEQDGAWAQGVVNSANWLGNPNIYCISIEHVKNQKDASGNFDNSDPLTPEQQAASFALIKDICQRNGIGMYDANSTTGITSHASIDPVNRSRCPGPYPWDALWAYLKGGQPVPSAHQLQAAIDQWNSVIRPPQGTGIFIAWQNALFKGIFYGPPLCIEYNSIDWYGNPVKVQEFARARCEWSNGVPNWYSINGKI